jgi:hypothetical protein
MDGKFILMDDEDGLATITIPNMYQSNGVFR